LGAIYLRVDPILCGRVRAGNKPLFPINLPIDPALQDLICMCLMYDPTKRPTPAEILTHPFLTGVPLTSPVQSSLQYPLQPIPPFTSIPNNITFSFNGIGNSSFKYRSSIYF
jgi:serine/threonine protein kinase